MSLLELRHVSKAYNEKVLALDDVNLTVEKGEWLAVMGPSGSGKSTLMNIIGCMDSATSGEVILDGDVLTDASPEELTRYRRDKIGMVFQQFHMIPYLTAVENIMVAQYYHSMPDRDEAMAALERVGLADRASHLPSQLSGGEQQRVCIARALINYPVLILADEPTGNLDEVNQNLVMKIFRELHAEGHTILTVTHSAEVGDEAMAALERVGLADRASHLPSQLSGGEQQRVCIARALINYPVLILADEPTGNLDEQNQKLVMKIFHELHDEGHTILTVTHSAEVGDEAQRCVIIEHGHMRERMVETI